MSKDLHERIADALGWTVYDAKRFSLISLRDVVRPVFPKLAAEITDVITSGKVIIGPALERSRRS